VEFRCRVGHIFSADALLEEHTSTQERKLYEAILALDEGARLAELIATSSADGREEFSKEAEQLRAYSAAIRAMVEERITPSSAPAAGHQT
jgi:hypothetical protein